jgi:hypothetical protein
MSKPLLMLSMPPQGDPEKCLFYIEKFLTIQKKKGE